jgi:hypothetical protein
VSAALDQAAATAEQALRTFIDSTRYLAFDDDGNDPLGEAYQDFKAALEHMRFQRGYTQNGIFKDVHFGKTPQMPVGPMWPQHELAFAWLRTGERETNAYSRERFLALIHALEALQRQLVFEADCQESIDALNTSRQYLQAAAYLDRAVSKLVSLI